MRLARADVRLLRSVGVERAEARVADDADHRGPERDHLSIELDRQAEALADGRLSGPRPGGERLVDD